MTRNPIVNALGASVYILLVVTVMNLVTRILSDKPDTFFAPVGFLTLLTLSAAVMVYLFFYNPVLLLVEGKKKAALRLFAQTVGVFGIITAVVLSLLLLRLI